MNFIGNSFVWLEVLILCAMQNESFSGLYTMIKNIIFICKKFNYSWFSVQVIGYLNLLANCVDNFTHGLAVAGSFSVSRKVSWLNVKDVLSEIFYSWISCTTRTLRTRLWWGFYTLYLAHFSFVITFIKISNSYNQHEDKKRRECCRKYTVILFLFSTILY